MSLKERKKERKKEMENINENRKISHMPHNLVGEDNCFLCCVEFVITGYGKVPKHASISCRQQADFIERKKGEK